MHQGHQQHGQQPQHQQPQQQCPECGAPAPFRGTAVSLVCEYCNSTIVRDGADIKMVGKVSAIIDTGSPIILNAHGRLGNLPFEVAGRLQVTYKRGTWNEWFLTFGDGTIGWLADAQGDYSIVRPQDPSLTAGLVPPYDHVQVGTELRIGDATAIVVDKRGAAYQGAEGILPFQAQPGMTFFGVDLRGYNGEFYTLDYHNSSNHQQPIPYVGNAIDLEEVQLRPLRRFEGWK
jgi:hypothetical protein